MPSSAWDAGGSCFPCRPRWRQRSIVAGGSDVTEQPDDSRGKHGELTACSRRHRPMQWITSACAALLVTACGGDSDTLSGHALVRDVWEARLSAHVCTRTSVTTADIPEAPVPSMPWS